MLRRAGSNSSRLGKVETKDQYERMMKIFTDIGLPKMYSLDKTNYTKNDISEIGKKVGAKVAELKNQLKYE